MYAIKVEFSTKNLTQIGRKYESARLLVMAFFEQSGFLSQNMLYYGNGHTSVKCIVATQRLVRRHPWLKDCAQFHLLRIDEITDLSPAFED